VTVVLQVGIQLRPSSNSKFGTVFVSEECRASTVVCNRPGVVRSRSFVEMSDQEAGIAADKAREMGRADIAAGFRIPRAGQPRRRSHRCGTRLDWGQLVHCAGTSAMRTPYDHEASQPESQQPPQSSPEGPPLDVEQVECKWAVASISPGAGDLRRGDPLKGRAAAAGEVVSGDADAVGVVLDMCVSELDLGAALRAVSRRRCDNRCRTDIGMEPRGYRW